MFTNQTLAITINLKLSLGFLEITMFFVNQNYKSLLEISETTKL